jgi:hypothetical protein
MFVICDSNNVVQDIASERANLSRGYGFPKYKLWAFVDHNLDIRIGDTFDGSTVTPGRARVTSHPPLSVSPAYSVKSLWQRIKARLFSWSAL